MFRGPKVGWRYSFQSSSTFDIQFQELPFFYTE